MHMTVVAMLLQTGVDQVTGLVAGTRDLTLVGALITATGVLWKSNIKKDGQLLEASKSITAAMTITAASQQELRKALEEAIQVKRELSEAIRELNIELRVRPCLTPGPHREGHNQG